MGLWKLRLRTTSREVYQSIDDLPIYHWFKINETNDYSLLVVKGRFTNEELLQHWENIIDEFIFLFGLSDVFKKMFRLKKELVLLNNDLAVNPNKQWLINKVKRLKKELEHINPTEKEQQNYSETIIAVENKLNRTIDEKQMSVRKFYTYLKQLENAKTTER